MDVRECNCNRSLPHRSHWAGASCTRPRDAWTCAKSIKLHRTQLRRLACQYRPVLSVFWVQLDACTHLPNTQVRGSLAIAARLDSICVDHVTTREVHAAVSRARDAGTATACMHGTCRRPADHHLQSSTPAAVPIMRDSFRMPRCTACSMATAKLQHSAQTQLVIL